MSVTSDMTTVKTDLATLIGHLQTAHSNAKASTIIRSYGAVKMALEESLRFQRVIQSCIDTANGE